MSARSPTEQSGALNGKSVKLAPLGFPRGEAVLTNNRHFGTDYLSGLMRGGDRLVDERSWMRGINVLVSTIQSGYLKL